MRARTNSTAPLRIALDARYVREKPSGIGAYLEALVQRLPGLSREDHFLFWAHRLAPRPLSSAPNVSEVTVRRGPASPLVLFWPQRYASFDGIDVFHSPANIMPRGVPCASVVTVHDVMSIERPALHLQGLERLVKSKYYQQAVWRSLREATRLITVSQATADRICVLEPAAAKRITVIRLGPDACFGPPENPSAARERAGQLTGGHSPYLLLVGANAPTKRHALALAAFAEAAPAPWRLVLLQRQKARDGLVRLAESLHIRERVVWLSEVARPDVVALIQAAEALLQPSIYEGFGLPMLEAMACGCPVVASDIPPFREVTGGAALLFPAEDVAKFGDALRELVRSPALRDSLRQQSLGRARDFSWDRCARETLEVYHEAAAARV